MSNIEVEQVIEEYLTRLHTALRSLSSEQRTAIEEEIRAHIDETAGAAGVRSPGGMVEILGHLGSPAEIALAAGVEADSKRPTHSPRRRRSMTISAVVIFALAGGGIATGFGLSRTGRKAPVNVSAAAYQFASPTCSITAPENGSYYLTPDEAPYPENLEMKTTFSCLSGLKRDGKGVERPYGVGSTMIVRLNGTLNGSIYLFSDSLSSASGGGECGNAVDTLGAPVAGEIECFLPLADASYTVTTVFQQNPFPSALCGSLTSSPYSNSVPAHYSLSISDRLPGLTAPLSIYTSISPIDTAISACPNGPVMPSGPRGAPERALSALQAVRAAHLAAGDSAVAAEIAGDRAALAIDPSNLIALRSLAMQYSSSNAALSIAYYLKVEALIPVTPSTENQLVSIALGEEYEHAHEPALAKLQFDRAKRLSLPGSGFAAVNNYATGNAVPS